MPLCRLPDTNLSYLWLGAAAYPDRDPVVLIHGLGASLAFWYPAVASALAQSRGVVLYDLRGHGRSGLTASGYTPLNLAEDLAGLLEALGISRAHLVGHSFGGSVGLAFALQKPAAVGSLTIVDARIRVLQPKIEAAPLGQGQRDMLGRLGADGDILSGAVGIDMLTKLAQAKLRQPDRLPGLGRVTPSPFSGVAGKAAALRWLKLVGSTTLSSDVAAPETLSVAQIAQCAFPVLLVYGQFSHAMRSALAFKEACAGARLEIVNNAGHFFPLTRPDALLAPLLRFLDRDAAGPRITSEDYTVVTDA
jgi:pimeloyl-ACP methyl ester carboxylesterase